MLYERFVANAYSLTVPNTRAPQFICNPILQWHIVSITTSFSFFYQRLESTASRRGAIYFTPVGGLVRQLLVLFAALHKDGARRKR